MTGSAASTVGQSAALVARVNEKKAELENLKELRDLSAAVASQMEALEQKLTTLSDGTEGARARPGGFGYTYADAEQIAIALVMANWHNVLRAINMASGVSCSLSWHTLLRRANSTNSQTTETTR
jgi:DASH complex subunit DAD2